jgi:hypothetical protein
MPHTPGPWTNDNNIEITAGEKSICGMRFPFDSESNQSNARLIAAAPELLEACEEALGAFENNNCIDWNILSEAIKKAKGE